MTEPNFKPASLAASVWSIAQGYPEDSHDRGNIRIMADWAARLEREQEDTAEILGCSAADVVETTRELEEDLEDAATALGCDLGHVAGTIRLRSQETPDPSTDVCWCPGCMGDPGCLTYEEKCDHCGSEVTGYIEMAGALREAGWVVLPPAPNQTTEPEPVKVEITATGDQDADQAAAAFAEDLAKHTKEPDKCR